MGSSQMGTARNERADEEVQAYEVGATVKKLLVLIAAAVGGFAIFRKITNDRAEQDHEQRLQGHCRGVVGRVGHEQVRG